MSVWESVDALKDYVYRSEHVEFFRRRAEWFEPDAKRVALWHVAAGTIPQLDEAVRRVEFLERNGSTAVRVRIRQAAGAARLRGDARRTTPTPAN